MHRDNGFYLLGRVVGSTAVGAQIQIIFASLGIQNGMAGSAARTKIQS
jgi:hypothetical protein